METAQFGVHAGSLAVVEIDRTTLDATPIVAHEATLAGLAAAPAVRDVGPQVDLATRAGIAVAARCRQSTGALPAEAALSQSAALAAVTAVLIVHGEVDTGLVAAALA